MVCPLLATWIKERNQLTCLRVASMGAAALMQITSRTSEPEVIFDRGATSDQWYEVLDLQWHSNNGFLCLTVTTAMLRLVGNTSPNLRLDSVCGHGDANMAGSVKL